MFNRSIGLFAVCLMALLSSAALATGPTPIGEADITFSYPMMDGMTYSVSDSMDFSGVGHEDAVPLGGNHQLSFFNSANNFGARNFYPDAIGDNETVIAHAMFKGHDTHDDVYFHDMDVSGAVTLEVANIQFDQPTWILEDTLMLHKMWDADQVDQLPNFYINVSNYESLQDPFRDSDAFFPLHFTDFPEPNYDFGGLAEHGGIVSISGQGTTSLTLSVTIPYSMFRNFEDVDQDVPDHLPAPAGYLEPFHFHVEYVVSSVPEPASLCLLLAATPLVLRRRVA